MSPSESSESKFCEKCGAQNAKASLICSNCGEKLPWVDGEPETPKIVEPEEGSPAFASNSAPASLEERNVKRNTVWGVISVAGILLLSVFFVNTSKTPETPMEGDNTERIIANDEATAQGTEGQTERQGESDNKRRNGIIIKELEQYSDAGVTWRNFLIRKNVDRGDLILLAQELHRVDPSSFFKLVDDDSKFGEFIDWEINYPNSSYPYPEEWATNHLIGWIIQASDTNGGHWEFVDLNVTVPLD